METRLKPGERLMGQESDRKLKTRGSVEAKEQSKAGAEVSAEDLV